MPIDIPIGTFRNAVWSGWRLTTGDRYLVMPTALAVKIEAGSPNAYWEFMARELQAIGSRYSAHNAWLACAA
jgi:hypothetical protein